jgi:hypothetical protein
LNGVPIVWSQPRIFIFFKNLGKIMKILNPQNASITCPVNTGEGKAIPAFFPVSPELFHSCFTVFKPTWTKTIPSSYKPFRTPVKNLLTKKFSGEVLNKSHIFSLKIKVL